MLHLKKASVVLAVLTVVACNDLSLDRTKDDPTKTSTTLPMNVITDPSVLNGHITNYKPQTKASETSWADVLDQSFFESWWPEHRNVHPFTEAQAPWAASAPGEITAYPVIGTLNIQNGGLPEDIRSQHIFRVEGEVESAFESGDNSNPYTIYVLGDLTVTRSQGNVNFVVCEGGSITVKGSQQLGNIFNHSSNPVVIEGGTSVNGKIVSCSGVKATGDIRFENASSNALVCNTFEGTNITVNDQANVAVGCMKLTGVVNVQNRTMYIEHGMEVGAIDLGATGKIVCANGAVLHAKSVHNGYAINLGNTHAAAECMQVYDDASQYAVLLAENEGVMLPIRLGTTDRTGYQTSDSYVIISGDCKFEGGGSGVENLGNARIEATPETSVLNRGCGSNYGPEPKGPAVLEELTDIAPVDHVHPISATGIALDGNTAYISWHMRGGSIHGCIEKMTMDGGRGTLNAWLETPEWDYNASLSGSNIDEAVDFNHIITSGAYVLTAGEHGKKGGILGRIPMSAFENGGNNQNILEIKALGKEIYAGPKDTKPSEILAGGSGNSVVRIGNSLLIASQGGHSAMPYSDITPFGEIRSNDIRAVNSNGSVKHIAVYGNRVATIEYTRYGKELNADWWEDNETSCTAVIKLWDTSSYPEECIASVEVPAFAPIYGKDVLAMDANYIYSCQGKNGVKIYSYSDSGIDEAGGFDYHEYMSEINVSDDATLARMAKGAANGLCVADGRLYVANSCAGVWVLDLSGGVSGKLPLLAYGLSTPHISQIDGAHDSGLPDNASANYVVATDQYIYVAYGRHGVRIFKNL